MRLKQLDTESADVNLTSAVTVLTHTPDATYNMLCQALLYIGDGAKVLDGSGGLFELSITVGGRTVQPSPQYMDFGAEAYAITWTSQFPVCANESVILKLKSPNAADTDVTVVARLYTPFDYLLEANTELTDMPTTVSTLQSMIQFLFTYFRNKVTMNKDTGVENLYQEDAGTVLGTRTHTDDATTWTKPELSDPV